MESEKFDLVFCGQIMPRQDLATVKANMAALFKISNTQVEALFSGKKVVLKRSVDLTAANRYRVAIKKAGARVELVKSGVESIQTTQPAIKNTKTTGNSEPQNAAANNIQAISAHKSSAVKTRVAEPDVNDVTEDKATQKNATQEVSSQNALKALPVGEGLLVEKNQQPVAVVDVPDFEVLDSGSDLLNESERTHFEPLDIDLSAITLRELGHLVDEQEIVRSRPVVVADIQVDVLPAGSQLVSDAERAPIVNSKIKALDLDVAPVGSRLEEEKPPAPPSPNVDHIQLADS